MSLPELLGPEAYKALCKIVSKKLKPMKEAFIKISKQKDKGGEKLGHISTKIKKRTP